jgi:hypothetical protein
MNSISLYLFEGDEMCVFNNVGLVNMKNANSMTSVFIGDSTASGWSTNEKRMPGAVCLIGNANLTLANKLLQSDIDGMDTPASTPVNRNGIFLG